MSRLKLLASLLLVACAATVHAADSGAAQLNTLYAEFWEENLKLNPLTATFAGDPRYNAELPNFLAPEYEEQDARFEQKYLDRARAIGTEGLTGQDRLSYDIFTLNRESALEELEFPDRLLPIDQFYNIANFFAQFGSGTSAQPFVTVKDYDDWLKRAAKSAGDFRPGHREHARGREGRHRAAARAHGEGAAAARREHRRRRRRRASSGARSRTCRRISPRRIANA